MLDARSALQQAENKGAMNITEGTKGGRGHVVDRWVPALPLATAALQRAAELQGNNRNLVPEGSSYAQWRDHAYHAWFKVSRNKKDPRCFILNLGQIWDTRSGFG